MSLLLWMLPFAAAEAPAVAPEPVSAVSCAHAVHFTTPYPWRYRADAAPVTEATVLVVDADADLLRPRNIGQRVLYVEGQPVELLAWEGDRALILAGTTLPSDAVRAWFADDTLPERVDAPLAARLAGAAAHLPRLPVATWGAPLTVAGRDALLARLADWSDGRCD